MDPRGEHRIDLELIPQAIQSKAGTYALLFESDTSGKVRVGRLGLLVLASGVYVYVGSALGSGGVRARVARHCRPLQRKHWHIDHLRSYLRLRRVLFTYCDRRLEHAWASALLRLGGAEAPLAGFGSSDCRCLSHLIYFQGWPDRVQFGETLKGASPSEAKMVELLIA